MPGDLCFTSRSAPSAGPRHSQTMYPLQGSEELALQPVPLEAHQNTVTMDTNLTGERSEKCVCVRGEREGERVKTGLCVCVCVRGGGVQVQFACVF